MRIIRQFKMVLLLMFAIASLLPVIATAALRVPPQINVQAIVRDTNGDPVSMSYEGATVSLWTELVEGTQIWAATMDLEISDGLVSIALAIPENVFAGHDELWLSIKMNDDLVVARRQLVSLPYAYYADRSATTDVLPPGIVNPFYGDTAPAGWLIADGSEIDKAAHPEYTGLVDHLRAMGNVGSDDNKAVLPDMRGLFLRGQDRSAGVNPDAAGDAIGQTQSDVNKSHTHASSTNTVSDHTHSASSGGGHTHNCSTGTAGEHSHAVGSFFVSWFTVGLTFAAGTGQTSVDYTEAASTMPLTTDSKGNHSHSCSTVSAGGHSHTPQAAGSHLHTVTVNKDGGNETRPKNMTVLYIIKY